MNRKFALFIVIALLTSLVWVSSVLAAPEVSMEVCVAVQGSRSVGNDESVTYKLTKTSAPAGAIYAGADTAAIQPAPNTDKACFDVTAEPGETYNLEVSAADTL
ncbi:MAG TPA: hypothetical protein ENJ56_01140, partial [Anaerolineae bacterium]|nr:hypothetical protein [Anaerolineae bacterium]